MFTFILSALGGAVIGSSYVLLRTPRTGKENQYFVKDLVQTTQANIQDVSDKAVTMQQAMTNLTTEVQILQVDFVPEVTSIANRFSDEAAVYTRRINDGVAEINREVENMNARIEARKNAEQ